jgi:hypothetical protein
VLVTRRNGHVRSNEWLGDIAQASHTLGSDRDGGDYGELATADVDDTLAKA